MKLEVGQKLWFSAPRYRTSKYVEITKVGRTYVHISEGNPNSRFLIADSRMVICKDGGADRGRCYPSKDEYDSEITTEKLWSKLRDAYQYSAPKGVTPGSIREAARILGIDLKEDGQ